MGKQKSFPTRADEKPCALGCGAHPLAPGSPPLSAEGAGKAPEITQSIGRRPNIIYLGEFGE